MGRRRGRPPGIRHCPCSLVDFLCFCALVFWLISFSFIIIILNELGQGQFGQVLVFFECDGLDISFLILSHLSVNTLNVANIFNVNGCYSCVHLFTYHCSFALFSDGHMVHLQHHSCVQNITQFMGIILKNIELIPHPWGLLPVNGGMHGLFFSSLQTVMLVCQIWAVHSTILDVELKKFCCNFFFNEGCHNIYLSACICDSHLKGCSEMHLNPW